MTMRLLALDVCDFVTRACMYGFVVTALLLYPAGVLG